ncbi:fusion protein [Vibrio phage Rostov 13]|uniref:Fusion protein n=1 Tax=Vibrio phage Rostov 13 TaxID=2875843 RepID=A0A8K1MYB4_9CAUD|nr:fusion protein [Vibrio phage Rostov 13]
MCLQEVTTSSRNEPTTCILTVLQARDVTTRSSFSVERCVTTEVITLECLRVLQDILKNCKISVH